MTGEYSPYLEVFLYCNQFQLVTSDALYSDGYRYIPAVTTARHLKGYLPSIHNVLVLGAGLGSMVHVLRRRGGDPHITLVEKDKVVLGLAMEFLGEQSRGKITPVCNDALVFMANNTEKYDLVFVDVFNGRVVPDFVCSPAFLGQCKSSLMPGGHVAFNYIVNNHQQWEDVKNTFTEIFPASKIIEVGINRILLSL